MPLSNNSLFCVEILADADPVLLIRLTERIQSLGISPRRLLSLWHQDGHLSMELVGSGLEEIQIKSLALRVAQFTTVRSVHWRFVTEDLADC